MKKKIILIIVVVFVILLLLGFLLFFSLESFITFELKGKKQYEISLNNRFKDPGYQAMFMGRDISEKVNIQGKVDSTKIGLYKIKYTIKFLNVNKNCERKILVRDLEKPIIKLNGDEEINIYLGNKYNEFGAIASDNYDGDLTNRIQIIGNVDTNKVGSYELVYKVIDSSENESSVKRIIKVVEKKKSSGWYTNIISGPTYIKGILIVNKYYSLPSSFGGDNQEANDALFRLQTDARKLGYQATLKSGYRSYYSQQSIYNGYVAKWGQEYTDKVSARPGHSEHQTGLAFDITSLNTDYSNTAEGKWLESNCHKYGFIIRYPKDKTYITGYSYEPWHIRYVGVDVATYIMKNNLTLEEYLGIA